MKILNKTTHFVMLSTLGEPAKIVTTEIETKSLLEEFRLNFKKTVNGIDPGSRHMGYTRIEKEITYCYEILLPTEKNPMECMLNIDKVLDTLIPRHYEVDQPLYIEGASHGEKFGQVRLAEARAMAMIAFSQRNDTVSVFAPSSIRKTVFGKGILRAEEVWKKILPPNAASSLAVVLCGLKKGN